MAAEAISYLRLYAGRHPDDPLLDPLVADLSADPDFARLWEEHRVAEKTFGVKLLRHPELGDLDFAYETLALPGTPTCWSSCTPPIRPLRSAACWPGSGGPSAAIWINRTHGCRRPADPPYWDTEWAFGHDLSQ